MDATFDERAYGFGNLTDLLRAAHREGIVRVDRDRQGVIRVFQGSVSTPAPALETPADVPALEPDEVAVASAAAEIGVPLMPVDSDISDAPAMSEEAETDGAAAEPQKKRRSRTPRTAGTTTRTRRKKT
jgi:hypothetical protein